MQVDNEVVAIGNRSSNKKAVVDVVLGLHQAGAGYAGGRWPQDSTTRGMQPMVPGVRA